MVVTIKNVSKNNVSPCSAGGILEFGSKEEKKKIRTSASITVPPHSNPRRPRGNAQLLETGQQPLENGLPS